MSGLKQLKTQIKTIKTTTKITSAMRMISVSSLRKSHKLLLEAYPYFDEITRMLRRLVRSVSYRQEQITLSGSPEILPLPFLLKGRDIQKKHIVICATSDEGLCGRFNISVVNKAQQVIEYLQNQGDQQVSAICFGTRGGELLKRRFPDLSMHILTRKASKDVSLFQDAERTALVLMDMFSRKLFDQCTVVFSEFESAAVQKIKVEQIIPLQTFQHKDEWSFLNQNNDPAYVKRDVLGRKKLKTTGARLFSAVGVQKIKSPLGLIDAETLLKESTRLPDSYDYESSDLRILDYILPLFIEAHVYKILLNTMASESAARMVAMESASKNATEMMNKINKKYHRKRQELVTKDLTEVVAGSTT